MVKIPKAKSILYFNMVQISHFISKNVNKFTFSKNTE